MDFSKFTDKARNLMGRIDKLSKTQQYIGTEHFVVAILEEDSYGRMILTELGVTTEKINLAIKTWEEAAKLRLAQKDIGGGI